MGSLAILASLTATLLPETLHKSLPQTIEDVKRLQNDQYFCLAPVKEKPDNNN